MKAHLEVEESKVIEVFANANAHRLAAGIVKRHSTNPQDIRLLALKKLDLTLFRNILDLGCGFGFFTEALKGLVHAEARVTGIDIVREYEPLYLDTCRRAGLKGSFQAMGVSSLKKHPQRSFDFVLCSYALYFFPEIIPDIARILNEDGFFLTIAHRQKSMSELIAVIKQILEEKQTPGRGRLPIEEIIGRFCSENGANLLTPWFKKIAAVEYPNSLVFHREDIIALVDYFRFKGPFFLTGTGAEAETVSRLVSAHLEKRVASRGPFTLSKDDTIFICSHPSEGK